MGRVGTGLTIGGLVIALGVGGLYLGRRAVAEEVLVGWLHRRGIAADVQVQKLEWDGFSGKIIVGDPDDPDVRVDRVDVDYLIGLPWMKEGFGLTPKRIVLSRPLIKAEWTGQKLSFGSLDPLIEEFTSKPPSTKPGPQVVVQDGQGLISTPYGPVRLKADARLNDSRLEWIKASLDPAPLALKAAKAEGLGLTLEASSNAQSLNFKGHVVAASVGTDALTGRDLTINLSGTAPYPQKAVTVAHGPVRVLADLTMASLDGDQAQGRDIRSTLEWSGLVDGWFEKFVLEGQASLNASAKSFSASGQALSQAELKARNLDLAFSRGQKGQEDGLLRWTATGAASVAAAGLNSGEMIARNVTLGSNSLSIEGRGSQFETRSPLVLTAASLKGSNLDLKHVRSSATLDVSRGTATQIFVRGNLTAQGRYDGLGPAKAGDAPELARLKQAARDFTLSAPAFVFEQSNRQTALQLQSPARIHSANGADLQLAALNGPLLQTTGGAPWGAARLTLAGQGLPQLDVDVTRWNIADGGFNAVLDGDAQLDFTPVSGIAVKTSGTLSVRNGVTRFVTPSCADLQAQKVNIGENNLEHLNGRLCPDGQPLFTMQQGRWTLAGRLQDTNLRADFLEAALASGSGRLNVSGREGDLGLTLTQIDAMLRDTSATAATGTEEPALRFNPVKATGDVSLRRGIWSGALDLTRGSYKITNLKLEHDNRIQSGTLKVMSEPLSFTPGGLQPETISPMLASFMTNAQGGAVTLDGGLNWNAHGVTSGGELIIGRIGASDSGLSFDTPAGRLEDLQGRVQLVDLLDPRTDGPQTLTARRLNAFVPIDNLQLDLALDNRTLIFSNAGLTIAHGQVKANRVEIPLDGSNTLSGELQLIDVQINDLLAAANLRDKVSFDAMVSGPIGFTYDRTLGWQIKNSTLSASSGRLSIQPEVLTGLSTGEGELTTDRETTVEVPPSAMQDLAYQALENLAIQNMSAMVQSQPDGRLGINFIIDGRHDPPRKKEMRVSIIDLLRGNFMQKKMDLPSATPVILRLNTSWNANELATEVYHMMQRRFEQLENPSEEPVSTD